METPEIIELLKQANRREVADATGLPYMYLSRLAWGVIKNPGSRQVDALRAHFQSTQASVPVSPPSA